jgi:hypothetical protein
MQNLFNSCKIYLVLSIGLALSSSACTPENKSEVECVQPQPEEPPQKKEAEVKRVMNPQQVASPAANWCRACVMGPNKYASCIKVYSTTDAESRESVRSRARTKACLDSGFADEKECPDSAVISISCKGDAPPPGTTTPSNALQQLFYSKNPSATKKDDSDKSKRSAPKKDIVQ